MYFEEFQSIMTTWTDLFNFCRENDMDTMSDVYDYEDMTEYLENSMSDMIQNNYWYDVRDILNDIPDNCEFFIRTGSWEFEEASNYDFDNYVARVYEEAREYDIFDDEDDEDSQEEPEETASINSEEEEFVLDDVKIEDMFIII